MLIDTLTKASKTRKSVSQHSEPSFAFLVPHPECSAMAYIELGRDIESLESSFDVPLPHSETSGILPLNSQTYAVTLAVQAIPVNRDFISNHDLYTKWATLVIYSPVFIS